MKPYGRSQIPSEMSGVSYIATIPEPFERFLLQLGNNDCITCAGAVYITPHMMILFLMLSVNWAYDASLRK